MTVTEKRNNIISDGQDDTQYTSFKIKSLIQDNEQVAKPNRPAVGYGFHHVVPTKY